MTVYKAIICGLVQGLTEFFPVSSSAHLALCERLFKSEAFSPDVGFDILLHLGTLFAVAAVCKKELKNLFFSAFSVLKKAARFKLRFSDCTFDERLFLCLVCSSLPLASAAFLGDRVEAVRAYPRAIGVLLIVNGVMLLASDTFSRSRKKPDEIKAFDAFALGMFQLAAVFPGISRSGATVTGGLIRGFDREFAVKYSFLMSVPAVIGANVFSLGDVGGLPFETGSVFPLLAGMLASALSGLFAMKLLIRVAKASRFAPFAYYCVAAGLFAVFFIN